jgi:hypothetical protein
MFFGTSRQSELWQCAGSTPDDVIPDVVDHLAKFGFEPPDGGIRPVDPDYMPES